MPVRYLKPGITTSPRWNTAGYMAQSFYIRLLTVVDDYGRMDADLRVLRAYCFPLSDGITIKSMDSLCTELARNNLAEFYQTVDGKRVVQLLRWSDTPRSKPKFPEKTGSCIQLYTTADKCSSPSPSPSSFTPSPSLSSVSTVDKPDFKSIWSRYPNKDGRKEAERHFNASVKTEQDFRDISTAIENYLASKRVADGFIKNGCTWFNNWRDWVSPVDHGEKPGLAPLMDRDEYNKKARVVIE